MTTSNKLLAACASIATFAALTAAAPAVRADTGKLVLTGGVSSVEGPAGGGITPWAVIGTNATEKQFGASAYISRLPTQDWGVTSYGAAVAWSERVELSLARQSLNAGAATALNGLGFSVADGDHIKMDIVGLKVRVAGEAILDADTWMPQIAVGLLYKDVDARSIKPVLEFLGTKSHGYEPYVSVTKLFLTTGVLVNATLRNTNANQGGLLGFGSAAPGRNRRSWEPEFSVAYLLRRNLAVGAEYRFKPNNLEALGNAAGLGSALREDDWKDIFIVWAPTKNLSLTAAYVDLGRVVPGVTNDRKQHGGYISAQVAF